MHPDVNRHNAMMRLLAQANTSYKDSQWLIADGLLTNQSSQSKVRKMRAVTGYVKVLKQRPPLETTSNQ